jgi:hypothetical protein
MLANQLHQWNSRGVPEALAACAHIAGDLWRVGATNQADQYKEVGFV